MNRFIPGMRANGRTLLAGLGLLAATLPATAATFAKGADVSWVDQKESSGYVFRNSSGTQADPYVLLKGLNVNSIRLRVWVNPSGGWSNGADLLNEAKRAIAQGQRVLVDFHYSDTWADPSHQAKPAAWASHTVAQLQADVYAHTKGILDYLKANGVTVTWVQVGNEINSGMLWPEGKVSGTTNWTNLAGYINNGYNAAKASFPSALVVVHLANGYDDADFRWFFDSLKTAGGKWDVTGMSHYPATSGWQTTNNQAYATMQDMVSRYAKPVMVCETGMSWDQAATAKLMLADLVSKTQSLGSNGLGVFYWEPEAYPSWQGYTLGAVNASGQFTAALSAY